MHVNFQDCNVVEASKLLVVAPEESPNTDGIHVTRTSNINILESEIRTGRETAPNKSSLLIQLDYGWKFFLKNNNLK